MEKPRNLLDFDSNELTSFLNSFDTIVTDCDGVLWIGDTPIAGSLETLKQLQNIGKKILFVSNNSTQNLEEYCTKFRELGFETNADQIAIPSKVICWYLKKLGFNGKAMVMGTNTFRQTLISEGIDVTDSDLGYLEERLEAVYQYFRNSPPVDAVIMDLDINCNWARMCRAVGYLRRSQVHFLAGALDRTIPAGRNLSLLGPGPFADIISKECKREPVHCGKPSNVMKDYVIEKFGIIEPSKCIFIGDSLESDMRFADLCGFRKLLVGSGIDNLKSMIDHHESNTDDNRSPPDYYLPSLGDLNPVLDSSLPLNSEDHFQKTV